MFVPGQRWISTAEPELGLGTVLRVEGRGVQVLFAKAGVLRPYAMESAPLVRAEFRPGQRIAGTLFLADPNSYDGGELIVSDTYGEHAVKLPAGDLVIYPASSLHRVAPVTRGARVAAFFWVQSLVRDERRRRTLFELDQSIQALRASHADAASVLQLTGVYHNLLREWSET